MTRRFLLLHYISSKSRITLICPPQFAGNPLQQQKAFFTAYSSLMWKVVGFFPVPSPLFHKRSFLNKANYRVGFNNKAKRLIWLDVDTEQIYTLTSILLEDGLVQISLSHWIPPCPGVASEPPQTADDWAVTHSRPHFSLCDCPQSSELCPKTKKHTLLTSRKKQYIFSKNSTVRL